MATAKQVAFLRRLVDEIDGLPMEFAYAAERAETLSVKDASSYIDRALTYRKQQPRSWVADLNGNPQPHASRNRREVAVTEEGMYRLDEVIYKVQRSKQSGRLYAKKLVEIGGKRLHIDGRDVLHFEFEYANGAIFDLRPEHRLSEGEAREFGIRYGVCCVCGTPLKDAESVAYGIGPVCRKRF